MSERTITVDCPRCGQPVVCRVYRADAKLRLIDVSMYSGRSEAVTGVDADVEVFGSHSCPPAEPGWPA